MRLVITLLALSATVAIPASAANPVSFRDRIDYATSISVPAVGDLNGDGIPDLMTCGGEAQAQIGQGDGTFNAGPLYSSDEINCEIPLLADLNGDGKLDLVMSFYTLHTSGLAVAIGNGDATFQTASVYVAGSDGFALALTLVDINNDHIPDVAMLGKEGIWIFVGQGGGTFSQGSLLPISSPQYYGFSLLSADLNGDGKPDLVAGTASGFVVLLGNGDGSFQSPTPNNLNGEVRSIVARDIDGDQKTDLIVTSSTRLNAALLLLGNGDASFQRPRFINLPNEYFVAIGDVNGDGKLDLVSNTGYVALGTGTGKFRQPVFFPDGSDLYLPEQTPILLADLRNTGHLDLVATHVGSFSVLLNKGNGTFIDGTYLPTNGSPSCPVVADFNHDGKPDMASASNGQVMIYLGTGKAVSVFETPQSIPVPGAYCLAGADYNKDGNLDLAVLANGTLPNVATVTTLLGDGAGGFTQLAVLNSKIVLGGPLLADFNRDGNLDLAFTGNAVSYGNGDGTFGPVSRLSTNLPSLIAFATFALVADFNGDNLPDLAFPDAFNNTMYILLNQGKGKFSVSSFSASVGYCIAADVNRDGHADMICNNTVGDIVFFLGNGDGTFQTGDLLNVSFFAGGALLYTDLNGDGIPDIGQTNEESFGVFQGNGDGTFQTPIWFGAGPDPALPVAIDLHGQSAHSGLPDIVITDGTAPLLILSNTTPR